LRRTDKVRNDIQMKISNNSTELMGGHRSMMKVSISYITPVKK
jgi:hypothetical protein